MAHQDSQSPDSLNAQEQVSTTLETLILSPHLMCPQNEKYGCEVSCNLVSPIHFFGGKHWQLRSVKVRGKWYLLPFVITSGGTPSDKPIVCDGVLAHFHIDKTTLDQDQPYSGLFDLVHPFTIKRPLCQEWDEVHKRSMLAKGYNPLDMRFNLIGSEAAGCIIALDLV